MQGKSQGKIDHLHSARLALRGCYSTVVAVRKALPVPPREQAAYWNINMFCPRVKQGNALKWFLLAYLKLGAFFFTLSRVCVVEPPGWWLSSEEICCMWPGLGTPRLCSWGEAKLWNWWNPTNQIERWESPVLTTAGQRLPLKLTGISFLWDAGTLSVALPMSLGAAAYVRHPGLFGSWYGSVCKSFVLIWWGLQPPPSCVCENTEYLLKCSECDGSTKRSVQTALVLFCCLGWEEAHWGTWWLCGLVWSLEGEWQPVSLPSYW